ncbi:MAG: hypothetical protein K6F32_00440 [Bacilli bacterium]|nr:hypothetical protein [Bacilli bacterium]
MTKPVYDYSRLKHYQPFGLLMCSIATLIFGVIHFIANVSVLNELFALPEDGAYYGTIKIITMLLAFMISNGVFAFGTINALSGSFAKFVEIFHWLDIALLGVNFFDSLEAVPDLGFLESFGGVAGLIIFILSLLSVIALTIFAELTERYDKALERAKHEEA